jgi:hypothetical protein
VIVTLWHRTDGVNVDALARIPLEREGGPLHAFASFARGPRAHTLSISVIRVAR